MHGKHAAHARSTVPCGAHTAPPHPNRAHRVARTTHFSPFFGFSVIYQLLHYRLFIILGFSVIFELLLCRLLIILVLTA